MSLFDNPLDLQTQAMKDIHDVGLNIVCVRCVSEQVLYTQTGAAGSPYNYFALFALGLRLIQGKLSALEASVGQVTIALIGGGASLRLS
jgi:hypothetical protein